MLFPYTPSPINKFYARYCPGAIIAACWRPSCPKEWEFLGCIESTEPYKKTNTGFQF